ncbi:MAG TPA: class I SAM-dependent methyltransferase [Bryobacteraceae bacterium]|nr:class I SAM-dependent methyltransferase [Bryobacteraceae bacterium]
MILSALRPGCRILDLCCGTGHLSAAFCRRRLNVVGLDGSYDMLRFAKQNAPQAEFVVADARTFQFSDNFDAVIAVGDSLNHMLTSRDLGAVFGNVIIALKPGGTFIFDLNVPEAFRTEWHKSSTVVGTDLLMYVRGSYDKSEPENSR